MRILLIEKNITCNDKYSFALEKEIVWNGFDNFITYYKEDSNIGFYHIVSKKGIRKDFSIDHIRDYGTGLIAVTFHRVFDIFSITFTPYFLELENSYIIGIEYCVPKVEKIYKNLQGLVDLNLKIKKRVNEGLKTNKVIAKKLFR